MNVGSTAGPVGEGSVSGGEVVESPTGTLEADEPSGGPTEVLLPGISITVELSPGASGGTTEVLLPGISIAVELSPETSEFPGTGVVVATLDSVLVITTVNPCESVVVISVTTVTGPAGFGTTDVVDVVWTSPFEAVVVCTMTVVDPAGVGMGKTEVSVPVVTCPCESVLVKVIVVEPEAVVKGKVEVTVPVVTEPREFVLVNVEVVVPEAGEGSLRPYTRPKPGEPQDSSIFPGQGVDVEGESTG